MSHYQVFRVETRKQQKQFMELIWQLYKGDPNWVPPLRMNQEELVGFRRHPFYENAKCRAFIVEKDGKVVGRIVGIINHGHNQRYKEKRGFFGFFDCIDDQEAANHLFRAAAEYLKSEGMTDVRGPCNPSLNYELGTLVEGFDTPPTFMMTYNWPYYDKLIRGFGFEKTQDLYAFEGHIDMLDRLDPKLKFVIDEVKRRFNVTLRPASRRHFDKEIQLFLNIYNRALQSTWGFVPLTEAESKAIGFSLKFLIDPAVTSFVEVDGQPVGVGLGLPDYNPLIKKIDGKLFPFGFLRLLWGKKSIKKIRVISTNVVPEYQRWGLGLVALERMLPDCLANGIEEAEFSWVLESNDLSRGSLERAGTKRTKTYRLYDRSLSDIN
ncbi:MAG: GNAT family N-acetyltransferase [Pirellula sp.]|nr:GNAT family N-acetyltransferase [Pirellula sp.]